MTLDVYRGRKTTMQQKMPLEILYVSVNLVSGIIRLPSGWDFSVCIGHEADDRFYLSQYPSSFFLPRRQSLFYLSGAGNSVLPIG